MPKEFFEFDMTKPPGASWGLRIGGGVDRGKVIVIEKVNLPNNPCFMVNRVLCSSTCKYKTFSNVSSMLYIKTKFVCANHQ